MLTSNDLVLLVLEASGGTISGKTLLQKRLYFVGLSLNKDLGYRAHFYGPYSAEVNSSLSECSSLGFVDERMSGFGITDHAGYEVRRYDYVLSDEGKEVAEDLKARYKRSYGTIRQTLAVLKDSGDADDYQDLSIAAKTMHIVREHGGGLDGYGVIDEAKKLGWKVSKCEADKALNTVEQFNAFLDGERKIGKH